MNPVETYQESRMIFPGCSYQKISRKMECFFWGGINGIGSLSGMTKNSMGCLSRVAYLCLGVKKWMFCHGMVCPATPLYI